MGALLLLLLGLYTPGAASAQAGATDAGAAARVTEVRPPEGVRRGVVSVDRWVPMTLGAIAVAGAALVLVRSRRRRQR